MSSPDMRSIAVVGSGLIGRSWAMVFISGGYSVKIYDNQPGQPAKAVAEIRKQLEELEEARMLRGELAAKQQLALLSGSEDLAQALEGAFFVQSGLIGRSWAMVFISGGYSVKIYDNQPGQPAKAVAEIRKQLEELEEARMLRGELAAKQQLALLSGSEDLAQALEGAFFVQECVFEQLEVKQSVFQDIERLVGKDVILSSSTSCLVPSKVFSEIQNKSRCLVSHPVNPPYYVKLVELVPHPETAAAVMDTTHFLMTKVGQAPVRLRKEIDGFALNRVQAAIIAESWRLVQDGVISVQDIDLVMSEGLGMRYAFIGPMETMHLNAPAGLEDYMKRYGAGIRRILTSFGPVPDFSGSEGAESIVNEMCELIPADQQHLSGRMERRDQLLMRLAKLKKEH